MHPNRARTRRRRLPTNHSEVIDDEAGTKHVAGDDRMAIIHEAFLALEAEGLFERTGDVANGNIIWRATDPAMARPDAPPR